jgi:uncharacterized protein YcfL
MSYVLMILMSLSLVSCASNRHQLSNGPGQSQQLMFESMAARG